MNFPSFSSLAQPGERKLLSLKLFYAHCIWAMRSGLSRIGAYDAKRDLDFPTANNIRNRYLASLFAIYDVKEMARLGLAWWTFEAMVWADSFLKSRPDSSVFEYGSGASTIWLGRLARKVWSVEDDPAFFRAVDELKPANVNYALIEADAEFNPEYASQRADLRDRSYRNYVEALERAGKESFDLIVIDGRCRRKCVDLAPSRLKQGGAILIDNTDMARYSDLRPEGNFKTVVTRGLTPCLPYPTETKVFVAQGWNAA